MQNDMRCLIGLTTMQMVIALGCGAKRDQAPDQSPHDLVIKAAQAEATKLANEFEANAEWFRGIPGASDNGLSSYDSLLETVYSIDISRALLGPRRIAFVGELLDIRENADGFVVVFAYPDEFDQAIVFNLAADAATVDEILQHRPASGDKYAVVAEIARVDSPLHVLRAYAEGVDEFDDAASIQVEHDGIARRASGRLVACRHVPLSRK